MDNEDLRVAAHHHLADTARAPIVAGAFALDEAAGAGMSAGRSRRHVYRRHAQLDIVAATAEVAFSN